MYEIKTGAFSGPLEKLLELIEEKKMDITGISMAEVTADFLLYVNTLKDEAQKAETSPDEDTKTLALRMLADFLVVAAQLILIKSKALLPNLELSPEEEEGINDLERRLKIYSQLKPMFALVKNSWLESTQMYSRTMLTSIDPVFYPPKNIKPSDMATSLGKLLNTLGSLFLDRETIKKQLFSLEDKIIEVTKKITQGISKFSEIIGKKKKDEVIILFLALLHLLRENTFSVSQTGLFDEIHIEGINKIA
jgi:segregation and condensation protein A